MKLTGKVVTLRPLTIEDAAVTLRWRLSRRARFLNRGARTVEEQRAWIASKERAGELNFIIAYKEQPVGTITLHDIVKTQKRACLGRLLVGEQEKVGAAPVAFEAELLLCDYVFEQLSLHKVHGVVMQDNIAMIRTRLYLGWKQDGVLRDDYFYDGLYKNVLVFSILEDEYWAVCRPKLVGLIELFSRFAQETTRTL